MQYDLSIPDILRTIRAQLPEADLFIPPMPKAVFQEWYAGRSKDEHVLLVNGGTGLPTRELVWADLEVYPHHGYVHLRDRMRSIHNPRNFSVKTGKELRTGLDCPDYLVQPKAEHKSAIAYMHACCQIAKLRKAANSFDDQPRVPKIVDGARELSLMEVELLLHLLVKLVSGPTVDAKL